MSADSAGYVTDVAYMPGFYGNMAPHTLRYIAALNGFHAPSATQPFRYLELGCGLGQTFMTLAAANPQGEFVGVDVNDKHVDAIDKDIKAGGLTNASALLADFASIPASAGQFDFIGAHGVLSWVAPVVQQQLLDAVGRLLKPGGLFLVSYNAMPGWAGLSPIREMITQYAATKSGTPLQKIEAALQYLKHVSERHSEYFDKQPAAKTHLQSLFKHDRRYLVHEYLNEHWAALYFHTVAGMCQTQGLQFVGSLPAVTNHLDLCVKPELYDLFKTTKNRNTLETHKDFCANFMFRWDVYGKDATPLANVAERVAVTNDLYLHLTDTRVPYHVHLGCGAIEIKGPEYELLQVLLEQKSLTTRELIEAANLPEDNWTTLVKAIDVGLATGLLSFGADRLPKKEPVDQTARYTFPSQFNKAAANKVAFSGEHTAVASPTTGTGHILKEFDAGIALALTEHGPKQLAENVDALMTAKNRTLKRNNAPITDAQKRLNIIRPVCENFMKTILPEMLQINVLAKTPEP
jgi:SAM-dependent methyltransferase